ncbi:hypothetical protein RN01_05740 [Cupriavidus sp. SHE]|jgi:hypothetical protein|nr:hypothetical protein RN01_05740 [Cupriavidus sp. SHE]
MPRTARPGFVVSGALARAIPPIVAKVPLPASDAIRAVKSCHRQKNDIPSAARNIGQLQAFLPHDNGMTRR